jgi:hypothetical protein
MHASRSLRRRRRGRADTRIRRPGSPRHAPDRTADNTEAHEELMNRVELEVLARVVDGNLHVYLRRLGDRLETTKPTEEQTAAEREK